MIPQSRFGVIIDILEIAFSNPVSESDYHNIVRCLREYDRLRDPEETERYQLRIRGWPEDYHPCEHMENVRWGFAFVDVSNQDVTSLLTQWFCFNSPEGLEAVLSSK
jgi:hypothetical protein